MLLLTSISLHATTLLPGDVVGGATSLSFPVGAFVYEPQNGIFFLGSGSVADLVGDAASYTISVTGTAKTEVLPTTPERVTLNGVSNQLNPFYGKQINFLGLSGASLLGVLAAAPTDLYLFVGTFGTFPVTLVKSDQLLDANPVVPAASAGVVNATGNGAVVFAAVKAAGGQFGDNNGGIALFAKENDVLVQQPPVVGSAIVQSVALQVDTPEVFIGGAIGGLTQNAVDMCWDPVLQRLYIGLSGTSSANPAEGIRAVVMGYVSIENNKYKLTFVPIAADASFNTNDCIVGGVGANVPAVIQKVRVMHTSTGVSYLIVVGGTQKPLDPSRHVAALPLVDKNNNIDSSTWRTDPTHGVLADKNQAPVVNYTTGLAIAGGTLSHFYSRTFATTATTAGSLYQSGDVPATVGRGPLEGNPPAGANIVIRDVQVYRDTVFVAVDGFTEENLPGIYYSQALFDQWGAIKGWTSWARKSVSGDATDVIGGIGYSKLLGDFILLQGTAINNLNTLEKTEWSSGSNDNLLGGTAADLTVGLVSQLAGEFSAENDGVQGMVEFPKETVGLSAGANQRLSLMVAMGYKKVVLVQTGRDNALVPATFFPETGDFGTNKTTRTDGSTGPAPAAFPNNPKIISITGGVLDDIGGISSAVIVRDAVNGCYLVVGGVYGLAVLRTAGGNGWPAAGLQKDFSNLPANMDFVEIGDYSNIIKLWVVDNFLYVLTTSSLVRINSNTLNGVGAGTVLATPDLLGLGEYGSFSDFVASGPLGVLATNKGLYRISNGVDVRANAGVLADWTSVTVPGGYDSAIRLKPVSPTSLENEFATVEQGGMLYVMSGNVGYDQTAISRCAVGNSAGGVGANSLRFLKDQIKQNEICPMAYIGYNRNYFNGDGALLTTSLSKNGSDSVVFQSFPLNYSNIGERVFQKTSVTNINLGINSESTTIGTLLSNSAQGGSVIGGSFGIRVHE